MQKEIISSKQAIAILIGFIFGSSVVMGVNSDLCQDSWVGLSIALLFTTPIFLIYARIIKLYPEKDIYDIIEELYGKIISKIIIIAICWYAIHLGSLVLRNFSMFVKISALQETPEIILMIAMIFIVAHLVKSGIENIGRWSVIVLFTVLITVLITILFSIPKMDFSNLLPVFNHSPKEIATTGYKIFAFPFAETVLFLTIACSIRKKDSPYKIYLYAMIIGFIFLQIIIIRNLIVLGPPMIKASFFPSYTTARLIGLGDFLTRIEATITINFILAGITKIALCLVASAKGIAHLFKIDNYKSMVMPAALLTLALSSIIYTNVIQMLEFVNVYPIYALPFQIVIPTIIWLSAEYKTRKKLALKG